MATDTAISLAATPPPDIDLERWDESLRTIDAWAPGTLFLTHFGEVSDMSAHLTRYRATLGRAATEVGGPLPHQHCFAMPSPGRPRMGPAIAGATTTLRVAWVAFLQARHSGALAGGTGMRAQAPFAVAQAWAWHTRC